MTLSVDVQIRLGAFSLDFAHRFAPTGLTALFGASGSGKSTLLRVIAGLERRATARIAMGETVWQDRNAFVAPERRGVGLVFQDARLFPHLSVRGNLLYALRRAEPGGPGLDEIVAAFDLADLVERRPAALSGGETQRVAIGRALLASPKLILMDEPLASLDDARKAEILPYIERLRDETKIPILYVSHSISEVSRLATDVVVIAAGKVAASGPAADILSRLDLLPEAERDEAGALIELEIVSHDAAFGLTLLRSSGGAWRLPLVPAAPGTIVRARIRARDVMIATERPGAISALNVLPVRVADITQPGGAEAYVAMMCGADRILARITRHSVQALGLAPGVDAFAVVKAVSFDRAATAGPGPATPRPGRTLNGPTL
jgi:molybdate transport system ATP-binding protein